MTNNKSTSYLTPFPEDNIDPKEKDEKWMAKAGQAIYARYDNGHTLGFNHVNNHVANIQRNRMYSDGRQPTTQYKDTILGKKDDGPSQNTQEKRKGYANINWDVVSPMPKFQELMLGMLEEIDHNVHANSIDSTTTTLRNRKKHEMYVTSVMRDAVKKISDKVGLQQKPEQFKPRNKHEIELYESIGGFASAFEIGLEKLCLDGFNKSKWKLVARALRKDAWENARFCCRRVVDWQTGSVDFQYVDIAKAIIPYDGDVDFTKIPYAGYIESIAIIDLRQKLYENGYSEEQVEALAKRGASAVGRDYTEYKSRWKEANAHGTYFYDNVMVDVLHFDYKTIDSTYNTLRQNADGEMYYHEDDWGKIKDDYNDGRKRETIVKTEQNLYQASMIVGTDCVYDFHKADHVLRQSPGNCCTSFHFHVLPGPSKVERCIPLLDQIAIANYKLQIAQAAAAPAGLAIDISNLNDIDLGDGVLKPLEIFRVRQQTGSYPYRSYSLHASQKPMSSNGPFKELSGGIGPLLDELYKIMSQSLLTIMEYTGFTQISSASPDSTQDVLVGTADIAMSQTNNSMKPLYEAMTSLKTDIAKGYARTCIDLIKSSKKYEEYYVNKIGKSSVEALKSPVVLNLEDMGLYLEATPSKEEQRDSLMALEKAMTPGRNGESSLEYQDYLMIKQMHSKGLVKQANAYMAYKMNEKKRLDQERADRAQMIQAKMIDEEKKAKTREEIALETNKAKIEITKEQALSVIRKEEEAFRTEKKKELLNLESSLQESTGKDVRGNM